MAKKMPKINVSQQSEPPSSSAVKDSSQQIWLAGLGAFSKAQAQGSKAFEILVQEGLSLQRRTHLATQESIAGASSLMNDMSSEIQAQASHRLDKLETIFEDRVARALSRLGTPSSTQMNALLARLDQLENRLQQMSPPMDPAESAAHPASDARVAPMPRETVRKITKPAAGKKSASAAAAKSPGRIERQTKDPAPGKRLKGAKSG